MDQFSITRRGLLAGAASLPFVGTAKAAPFEVRRSDAEWLKRLGPARFAVLRQGKTERAGTSPLNRERRRGLYACAGCGLPLFSSTAKYDSGTGWPSFTAPLRGSIRTKEEGALFFRRTEVHCRRCGSHLGHVFDDGPPPAGKRFCMNGLALIFRAA